MKGRGAVIIMLFLAKTAAVEAQESYGTINLSQPDSISCGSVNRGSLSDAAELPINGRGYLIPKPWIRRGRRFGTKEMIHLIQRSAAYVDNLLPGGNLGVADISAEKGGAIGLHKSHQSGRDVDLIFYALDTKGHPFKPDSYMAYYGPHGQSIHAKAPHFSTTIRRRYFDLPRNWALVRALITDHSTEVSHIFVSAQVRGWLLQYAKSRRESKTLIRKANRILRPDKLKNLHNDHFHVRITCSKNDIALGQCTNGYRPIASNGRCPSNF